MSRLSTATPNQFLQAITRRYLTGFILTIATFAAGVSTALAQTVGFDVSTAPAFVGNTGRSEVVGNVTLTADAICGTNADTICLSTAGTLQVLYAGTPIDNSIATSNIGTTLTNGIEICERIAGVQTCNAAGAYLDGTFGISNTSAGGVVSFGVKGSVNFASGDQVIIRGVRGQMDQGPGSVVGTSIDAFLSSSPSTIAGFSPTQQSVARSADPLTVSISPGTLDQCKPLLGSAAITIIEGFNTAFVDYGDPLETSNLGLPLNPRTSFGATNNTRINIVLTGKPAGAQIIWPLSSSLDSGAGLTNAILTKVSQSTSGDSATYVFSTPNQALSDINSERFIITLSAASNIALSGTQTDIGAATAQGQLYPASTATAVPRYNHPLEPVPGAPFLTVNSCVPLSSEIDISATFNGAPWSGALSYQLQGPSGSSGIAVPIALHDASSGNYTLSFVSGGPPGAVFTGITPTLTQNLPDGGLIGFTLNFSTPGTIQVSANLDGVPWPGTLVFTANGPTNASGMTVPGALTNLAPGSYTVSGNGGGPSNARFTGATPSGPQTLTAGGNLNFMLNYVSTSSAQTVVFDVTATPTLVANTGRAEVLGDIVLSADPTCGTRTDALCTSTAGTLQILLAGVPIDNSGATSNIGTKSTNGIEICETVASVTKCNTPGSYLEFGPIVSNTDAGGIVSFVVNGGVNLAAGDQIRIRGIRGQIDLSRASVAGSSVLAFAGASPSTAAAFSPTSAVVAESRDPLTVLVNPATVLQCQPTMGQATITVIEGFNSAFVDQDNTIGDGTAITANLRPLYGPSGIFGFRLLANSFVNIVLTGKPAGMTITWPQTSAVDSGGGATGAFLNKFSQSSSGDSAVYVFSALDQARSDANSEQFVITLTAAANIALTGTSSDLGTATGQGQMFDSATSSRQPRYNHPLEPVPAPAFLTVNACQRPTDLEISKTVGSDPTLSGGNLTFTLTVQNVSGTAASGVSISDALPAGLTFESCTPSAGTCSAASGIVTASLGSLSGGAAASVELKAMAPIVAAAPAALTNSAVVSSTTADADPDNNHASLNVHITPVAIDIKPGDAVNSVNPKSNGKIPVAILTTQWFDATQVKPSTVRFGPGEALSEMIHYEDVDGDGDLDLLMQFSTEQTGIQCGDTSVILKGETFAGDVFQSRDMVSTAACKK